MSTPKVAFQIAIDIAIGFFDLIAFLLLVALFKNPTHPILILLPGVIFCLAGLSRTAETTRIALRRGASVGLGAILPLGLLLIPFHQSSKGILTLLAIVIFAACITFALIRHAFANRKYILCANYLIALLFVIACAGLAVKFGLITRGFLTKDQAMHTPSPTFTLQTANGELVTLESAKGKVLVLDFWASWCGPCALEVHALDRVHTRFANNPDVIFLAVNSSLSRDDEQKISAFAAKHPLSLPYAYDKSGLTATLNITSIPTVVIINRSGIIRYESYGYDADSFEDSLTTQIQKIQSER